MIDFPQAVDLLQNPHGFDLLHHDVITMTTWFTRKGVTCDGEAALRRAPRGGVLMAHLRVVPAKRAWLEALAESDDTFTALTGIAGGAGVDGGVPRHRALLPRAPRRGRRSGVEHPPLLRRPTTTARWSATAAGRARPSTASRSSATPSPARRNRGIATSVVRQLLAQASERGLTRSSPTPCRRPRPPRPCSSAAASCARARSSSPRRAAVWRWETAVVPTRLGYSMTMPARSSGSGQVRSRPSSTPTTIVATAQFRYHFLSAGMTCHGACVGARALDGLLEGRPGSRPTARGRRGR